MVKTLELAISKAASLPEAAQEQLGRELLLRIDTLTQRVVWSPRARQDLHDIRRYFARVASPDIADKLLREIAAVGQRLGERPLSGRVREEVMPGLRSVLIQPYSIFLPVKRFMC